MGDLFPFVHNGECHSSLFSKFLLSEIDFFSTSFNKFR